MPFRFEVSAAEGIVRTTATGRIQLDEIREHMARMKQAGAARFPEIVDVRRAEPVTFTLRDMLTAARLAHQEFGGGFMAPRAVVVGCRRHFEWARIFAALVVGWMAVGVFTDRHEALLWLEHKSGQSGAKPSVPARRAANG